MDSCGKNSVERKVVATTGATSDGVERLVENKRVKFDLRESGQDLSEGVEEAGARNRSLPRDVVRLHSRSTPSRVVTRQPTPSAKTDTFTSENLLQPNADSKRTCERQQEQRFFPNRGHREG